MAGMEGIEPSHTEPESAVLPLYYIPELESQNFYEILTVKYFYKKNNCFNEIMIMEILGTIFAKVRKNF